MDPFDPKRSRRLTRRDLLRASLAAGAALSVEPVLPEQPRNASHVSDPRIIGMLKEQMRTRDLEARRKIIFDLQRYAAEQQYYVYLYAVGITASWQPSVKNYAPAPSFDYGNRAALLWLDR